MAQILITYDVSGRQVEMKSELKTLGYSDSWQASGKTYYLPNTTLWKKDVSASQGKTDMINTANKLSISLERAIAVEFSSWDGIEGKPHS